MGIDPIWRNVFWVHWFYVDMIQYDVGASHDFTTTQANHGFCGCCPMHCSEQNVAYLNCWSDLLTNKEINS